MATIESLDLATLTNNPQSIAEALEDVLETSSGNISSLKSTAQTDQEYISNTLKPSAQSDADTLSDLVDDAPTADVLNLDLSVTDRSSEFVHDTNYAVHYFHAHSFNGFMFVSGSVSRTSTPPNTHGFMNVSSSYRPDSDYIFPIIGHQGDTAEYVRLIASTGNFEIHTPHNVSASTFYFAINGVYRFGS